MIVGIGLDMVEKKRITPLNQKLVTKILSEKEREVFESKKTEHQRIEYFGGRFAAKEAFFKALGIGISTIPFAAVSVLANDLGKPQIYADYIKEHNMHVHITITHTEETIAAMVVIEEKNEV